jgi:putrescine transport system ATP-binding protein
VNLFDGTLAEDEPEYVRVRCPELPVPVHVDHGVSAPPDAQLWVAIRPEKLNLQRGKPVAEDNWARGIIKDIAYMGDLSIYVVRLDSGRDVRVTQTNSARKAGDSFTWDDEVYLLWDSAAPVVGAG